MSSFWGGGVRSPPDPAYSYIFNFYSFSPKKRNFHFVNRAENFSTFSVAVNLSVNVFIGDIVRVQNVQ